MRYYLFLTVTRHYSCNKYFVNFRFQYSILHGKRIQGTFEISYYFLSFFSFSFQIVPSDLSRSIPFPLLLFYNFLIVPFISAIVLYHHPFSFSYSLFPLGFLFPTFDEFVYVPCSLGKLAISYSSYPLFLIFSFFLPSFIFFIFPCFVTDKRI